MGGKINRQKHRNTGTHKGRKWERQNRRQREKWLAVVKMKAKKQTE
jgi:hypothetical protein